MSCKEERLKNLGSRLKELRKEIGLSLDKVGNAISISHNFLSEIERGKKEPSNETLRSLASFYKIDEDELFGLLGKVPLRTTEYMSEDIHLQKLLSEVQKKYSGKPDKIKEIGEKVRRLYEDILDDDD